MIRELWGASRLSRTLMLGAALIILAILAVALSLLGAPEHRPGSAISRPGGDREQGFSLAVPSAQRVAGFVETYGPRVEENERDLRKLAEALQAADERQKKQEELLRALTQELRDARAGQGRSPELSGAAGPVLPQGLGRPGPEDPLPEVLRIQKIRLAAPAPPSPPSVHLPAGSFAEGMILTGAFAPVEGPALPLQIRLMSGWTTPNRGQVPLGDAFLIGKAQGDPNSERVIVQLEKLSYVHRTGRSVEVPVNGYVADRDGVQGAAGIYLWRASELLAYSALAGAAAGAGDALSQSQTSTTLNPLGGATQLISGSTAQFAGGRALSGASAQINQTVAKRLEQLVPAVWVPNGRRITVILIEGATLPGIVPKELEHAERPTPFAGLDLDR